jgi:hypothetical protein
LVDDSENDIELTKSALATCLFSNPIDVVRDGSEALDFLRCQGTFSGR